LKQENNYDALAELEKRVMGLESEKRNLVKEREMMKEKIRDLEETIADQLKSKEIA